MVSQISELLARKSDISENKRTSYRDLIKCRQNNIMQIEIEMLTYANHTN